MIDKIVAADEAIVIDEVIAVDEVAAADQAIWCCFYQSGLRPTDSKSEPNWLG